MPDLVILVGLPASGKSTSVDDIVASNPYTDLFIYSTDALIEEWSVKMGWSYNMGFQKYIKQATSEMNHRLIEAIERNADVIWDQTNMSDNKRRIILSKFPDSYMKKCICRVPPRDDAEWNELNHRLANRPGKNIPNHIVASMAGSYVPPSWDEGFDDIVIYDIYGNQLQ